MYKRDGKCVKYFYYLSNCRNSFASLSTKYYADIIFLMVFSGIVGNVSNRSMENLAGLAWKDFRQVGVNVRGS